MRHCHVAQEQGSEALSVYVWGRRKEITICELARSLTNKDVGGKIRNVGAREDRKMQETCIFSSPRLEV